MGDTPKVGQGRDKMLAQLVPAAKPFSPVGGRFGRLVGDAEDGIGHQPRSPLSQPAY